MSTYRVLLRISPYPTYPKMPSPHPNPLPPHSQNPISPTTNSRSPAPPPHWSADRQLCEAASLCVGMDTGGRVFDGGRGAGRSCRVVIGIPMLSFAGLYRMCSLTYGNWYYNALRCGPAHTRTQIREHIPYKRTHSR